VGGFEPLDIICFSVDLSFSGVVTYSSLDAQWDIHSGLCKTPNLLALDSMSSPLDSAPVRSRGIGAFVVYGALGFLGGEILAAIFEIFIASLVNFPGGITALAKASSPPWWANASGLAGLWIGFGFSIASARGPRGLPRWPEQWKISRDDWMFVVLGVGAQFLIDWAYQLAGVHSLSKPVNHLFGDATGLSLVLIGALTTLGAPLMEEWFFRGFFFRALLLKMKMNSTRLRVVLSVSISALAFAAAHAEPTEFVGLFALGVVLAYLVYRTNRLVPSVLTHVSFNAVALVSLLIQRSGH